MISLSANNNEVETDIVVIGTVHYSTYNYNSDTLLGILNRINPDVILVECDSSYMTADFELKEDIQNAFLETRAITKFQKGKDVSLRPYDISGRDIFLNDYNRKRNESNFFKDIHFLSRSEKLNNTAINILNKVLMMMSISEEMANAAASYINNLEGSKKIDTINYYTYTGLDKLIQSTPELSSYRSYWEDENKFWNERNSMMLENILEYSNYFAGKKIVVLCGLAHKNILKKGLVLKTKEENLNVKEYWEF